MKRSIRRLIVLVVLLSLALALVSATALAAAEAPALAGVPASADTEIGYGYIDLPKVGSQGLTEAYLRGEGGLGASPNESAESLPSAYDSRDYGYITAVGNQGSHGTCWAFAPIASIEANMIKSGIVNPETGAPATNSMNLSESHLVWFSYTDAYDEMGMLAGDTSAPVDKNYLDRGGNGKLATMTLMRWEGPASEKHSALVYSLAPSSGIKAKYAYQYDVAHVERVEWIPTKNQDAVKRAVMEYGAGVVSYYHKNNGPYYNSSTHAYCYIQSAPYGSGNYHKPNHAVTVVGWDDNYPRENFNEVSRPANDGAWIIKNSWGKSDGEKGYYYLSYEDTASYDGDSFFFQVGDLDNFDHNYQYDGTGNIVSYESLDNGSQIANVFTANGRELLRAVAVNTLDEAVSYTVNIYRNLSDGRDPASGTLVSTQSGYFPYPGYFTVRLNTPVNLNPGETFSVVFTLAVSGSEDENPVHAAYDCTASRSWVIWTHTDHGDSSFFKLAGEESWNDCSENGDFRIKAYTDDGTGAVVQLIACGALEATVNAQDNEIITLPGSVSVNPTGWEFCGWSPSPVSLSTECPATYAPGSAYTVQGDGVLYAVYRRGEYDGSKDVTGGEAPNRTGDGGMTYYYWSEPVDGHDHMLTHVPDAEPTCTQKGSWEHRHCAECGEYFSDFNGCNEISASTAEREALGHDWDSGVLTTPPISEENGVLTYTCLRCGSTRSDSPEWLRANPFADVRETKYYYLSVLWAYYHSPQITSGTSSNLFSPNALCNREQVVTFLWKANGAPEPETTENPFADVREGKYYYKAVLWAVENGITSGISSETFGVGRACTREQVVTFLWIANGKPAPALTENPFSDVIAGKYYCQAVLWALENGITSGVSSDKFGVGQTCTRGQIVTFLYADCCN